MWIFERKAVWEALIYLIDKYREATRRDEELLKIIQEQRHIIVDLKQEVEDLKYKIKELR